MSKHVIFYEFGIEDDSIFKIVSIPRHVRYSEIVTECDLSFFHRMTVNQDLTSEKFLSVRYSWVLVDLHIVIGTLKSEELKCFFLTIFIQYCDVFCIYAEYFTILSCTDTVSTFLTKFELITCSDYRRGSMDKRNCLTHHV